MEQKQIDLSQIIHLATDLSCESCTNHTFTEVVLIKKFSALVSPTGQEIMAPMPVFACNACGHVNKEFLPKIPVRAEQPPRPRISLDA